MIYKVKKLIITEDCNIRVTILDEAKHHLLKNTPIIEKKEGILPEDKNIIVNRKDIDMILLSCE